MAISKAQQKAVTKYNSNNYDTIYLRVKKGKKDIIKSYADKQNQSVNEFINRAIDDKIENDNS